METILLTGGTGFLGSHILQGLLDNGYNVIILKRSASDVWRIKSSLDNIIAYDVDSVSIGSVFKDNNIDIIIHTANSYGRKDLNEIEVVNSNILFGVQLAKEAVNSQVKLFINTDTFFSNYYTNKSYLGAYTLSKKQFVEWLLYYSKIKLNVANMEVHHVYGGNDGEGKFTSWLRKEILLNKSSIKLTKGTQLRDFIHVQDVVSAYLTVVKNWNRYTGYNKFIVSTGKKTSIREFTEEMYRQINDNHDVSVKLDFGALPTPEGEIMDVSNDCSALELLGWRAENDIRAGIKKMLSDDNV